MRIHMRTKQVRWWSYVESAVVQIGSDILEVKGGLPTLKGGYDYWVDGVKGPKIRKGQVLPFTIGGHKVRFRRLTDTSYQFKIFLGDGNENIVLKSLKDWMKIELENHTKKTYGTSTGILGNYTSGEMLGRDGVTVFSDVNAYGMEWQVKNDDPVLFHTASGPQYPDQCKMPSSSAPERRLLRERKFTKEDAESACAHIHPFDRDDCITDVLAADDLEMAGLYYTILS